MLIFKIYWFELQVYFFIFYLQQRDLQISSNKKVRLIFCYDLSRLKKPVFVMIFNSSNQGLKVHFIWLRIFVSVGTHFLRTSMIVKCESILNHFFFSHTIDVSDVEKVDWRRKTNDDYFLAFLLTLTFTLNNVSNNL